MPKLIQSLPEGPLAIIGDVHGEIDALLALLHRLGADPERRTATRPLVFAGDLVDRGPDSVQVVEVVQRLIDAGLAQAVLGNHELNLLLNDRKEGNGWFHGDDADHAQLDTGRVRFASRIATAQERANVLAFAAERPLVLERHDLRVVHACWEPGLRSALPAHADVAALSRAYAAEIHADLERRGVPQQARTELAAYAELKDRKVEPPPTLPAVIELETAHQLRNPVKLLTSGPERAVPLGAREFHSGKWRFVGRDRWWEAPAERPTVVGHYWRRRKVGAPDPQDVWGDVAPFAWGGDVYCVDYSVGYRYKERARGRTSGFEGGLGAMCWPERTVVFDDHEGAPTATA